MIALRRRSCRFLQGMTTVIEGSEQHGVIVEDMKQRGYNSGNKNVLQWKYIIGLKLIFEVK